jgi:hypothetical protein
VFSAVVSCVVSPLISLIACDSTHSRNGAIAIVIATHIVKGHNPLDSSSSFSQGLCIGGFAQIHLG